MSTRVHVHCEERGTVATDKRRMNDKRMHERGAHQEIVAVLWVGRELKHGEDDDEDQRQGHERRRVVATVGIVEEHEDNAGDRHGEVGETEPEEGIEPAAHLVDRVARQREQLCVAVAVAGVCNGGWWDQLAVLVVWMVLILITSV